MALTVDKASKSFPGVRALKDASLELRPGEVHALMGENGAGKSTLIKIITGVHRPDGGRLLLDGAEISLSSPRDAIRLGISAVHQERNLIPRFSVAENILLENLPRRAGLVDYAAANAEAKKYLEMIGLTVDTRTEVRHLSVAQMQMVEIAKALSHEAKVLLLDEPTASLTGEEAEALVALIKRLKAQGAAILFVSHKLEEVLAISDRVTVLRDGETTLVGEPMANMTRGRLIEAMIGRAERTAVVRPPKPATGAIKLEAKAVATATGHRDISFTVRRGEILGVYGLVGAGRTELARALVGKDKVTGGTLSIDGKPVTIRSVEEALKRHHIGYLSEDRKYEGVVLLHPIRFNVAMTIWDRLAKFLGFQTAAGERRAAEPFARQLEIRTPSLEQAVGNLSGGNQQKVSLAKWLAAKVDLLIIDEPTVGIDIKTKTYLHELIGEIARGGVSVLLISSDMPEMVVLADRILVMHDFRLVGEVANDHRYDAVSKAIMGRIHAVEVDAAE
ncbi:MAG: sugar ABC transporter ATP-binding protein [Devosia sp.]|nr:sugar ABC transporter ATP-binding protein [Devosia sp.]